MSHVPIICERFYRYHRVTIGRRNLFKIIDINSYGVFHSLSYRRISINLLSSFILLLYILLFWPLNYKGHRDRLLDVPIVVTLFFWTLNKKAFDHWKLDIFRPSVASPRSSSHALFAFRADLDYVQQATRSRYSFGRRVLIPRLLLWNLVLSFVNKYTVLNSPFIPAFHRAAYLQFTSLLVLRALLSCANRIETAI